MKRRALLQSGGLVLMLGAAQPKVAQGRHVV